MNSPTGTILVTTNPEISDALNGAFGNDALLLPISELETMRSLEKRLEQQHSGLVVIDIEPEPSVMLDYVGQLVDEHPRCRFVVIAPSFDKQLLLESMQAGARHFLPRDWIGPDVVPICRELVEQLSGPSSTLGEVYTVLSASGGCGATTVAVNLAAELGALASQRALVIDFDTRFGGVGTHLGVKGDYGLADLLAREGPLDIELVHSTAVERGSWLNVLLSPSQVNFREPAPLYLDEIEETLAVFRTGYPATVIDAPSLPFEATAALAGYSTATLITMQLTVKDLHNARLLLHGLSQSGLKTPVHVIANRCRGSGKPISLAEAADTLEFSGEIIPLPDDPVSAIRALNAGEPLLAECAKSKLRKKFTELAKTLSNAGADESKGRKAKRGDKKADKKAKRKAA
ncbi:MAG: hypothetical protein H6810_08590 [Phycisphaeraceae bacterium]|nr:MAG: hypothetical protein H6810_08590 [Phycisphaeraceae bacterium]